MNQIVDIIRRPWNKPGAEADMVFLATYHCTYKKGDITLRDENHAYEWITEDALSKYEFIDGYLPVLQKFFEKNHETV